jgi:hypothetical protein
VAEQLASKHEAFSSNPSADEKEKNKQNDIDQYAD